MDAVNVEVKAERFRLGVAAVCLVKLKIRYNTKANASAAIPMMPINFLLPA